MENWVCNEESILISASDLLGIIHGERIHYEPIIPTLQYSSIPWYRDFSNSAGRGAIRVKT